MEYSVGDVLQIEGVTYNVAGKIRYQNAVDRCMWDEYRLLAQGGIQEKWLSVDSVYKEYSISEVVRKPDMSAYHSVDQGVEIVVGAWGKVDVDYDERASFVEFEDDSEENIISQEAWSDGDEYSVGHYIDENQIIVVQKASGRQSGSMGFQAGSSATGIGNGARSLGKIITSFAVIAAIIGMFAPLFGSFSSSNIAKYLKKTTATYTYKTSITGTDKQDADVYVSSLSLDATAKDIIHAIDGNTTDVQQNTEDGDKSIAIMTKKEYCLVYESESSEVLVQISNRKFAYTNDSDPYHSRPGTARYYRRFYHSRGYNDDYTSYNKKYTSPYSSHNDDPLSYSNSDTYSSYSSTVRQASARARSSSGGGTSSGK